MKQIILIFLVLILISGCNNKEETKEYYLGVVPTPKSISNTTFDDLTNAYKETGEIADVTMVWTGINIGQTERLKQNKVLTALKVYNLKPVLTLSFATIKEKPEVGLKYVIDSPEGIPENIKNTEFRKQWINEAKSLASEFKPEYLSLGNEINDYFYLHPEDLEPYLSLYDEAYKEIKKVSPETKVFVIFSYTHLIDNNRWDLLEKFNDRVDLIGLTTYPWKHFENPEDISKDYYSKLKEYTNKPIAFTEMGWTSSEKAGSSEKEQAEFLKRFIELTKELDVEMINWLFLHEPKLEGIVKSVTEPETATISLKNKDGTKKEVYDIWLSLR